LDESKARGRAGAKVRTTAKAKADPPSGDDKQERHEHRQVTSTWLTRSALRESRPCLSDIDLVEAEAVEEGGYGGAGVFASGVEDAVVEGGFLELLFCFGAGVGFEVLVGGDEEAGGAGVDAGALIVEVGGEELRGGQGDMDGTGAVLLVDADIFGLELGEVDAGD
jgi:hypothetical protein